MLRATLAAITTSRPAGPRVQGVEHQNDDEAIPVWAGRANELQDYWQACSPAGAQLLTVRCAASAPAPPSGPAWPACVQMEKGNDPG